MKILSMKNVYSLKPISLLPTVSA